MCHLLKVCVGVSLTRDVWVFDLLEVCVGVSLTRGVCGCVTY